jgi:hypothetical protein
LISSINNLFNNNKNMRKRIIWLALEICVFSLLFLNARANQIEPALDVPREHVHKATDLANALVFVAAEYQVPMLAELTATNNPKIDIPRGSQTARQLLDWLVATVPGYKWEQQAGVIHFYGTAAISAPANPLNIRLKSFQLPENVSQLKLALPARLYNASQGFQSGGGAISAFALAELEQQKLPMKKFDDATGRDILLAAAASQPQFSSIIILPNAFSRGDKDLEYANQHWFWFATATHDRPTITANQ